MVGKRTLWEYGNIMGIWVLGAGAWMLVIVGFPRKQHPFPLQPRLLLHRLCSLLGSFSVELRGAWPRIRVRVRVRVRVMEESPVITIREGQTTPGTRRTRVRVRVRVRVILGLGLAVA